MYALKKEVIVLRAPPHYALFMSKGVIGSTHDYQLHKENCANYTWYLLKEPSESEALPADRDHNSWGLLLDSDYIGPESDTPNLRRIAMPKPSSGETPEDRLHLQHLASIHVPVEQFLGRFYKLWGIFRHAYRLDHSKFDTDFDSCVLLTNECIRQAGLTDEDRNFLLSCQAGHRQKTEERQHKRHQQMAAFLARKRQRIASEE